MYLLLVVDMAPITNTQLDITHHLHLCLEAQVLFDAVYRHFFTS
jgi:hypothetical protein